MFKTGSTLKCCNALAYDLTPLKFFNFRALGIFNRYWQNYHNFTERALDHWLRNFKQCEEHSRGFSEFPSQKINQTIKRLTSYDRKYSQTKSNSEITILYIIHIDEFARLQITMYLNQEKTFKTLFTLS